MAELIFSIEPFWNVYPEAKSLLEMHYQEIAKNKQLLYINPDDEKYKLLHLLLATARFNGELVGYFLWILTYALHYKHAKIAEEDLHFLHPKYRRGMNGYLFVRFACDEVARLGAEILIMREKVGHEHPAIMKRLGFLPTDIVYTKAI